MDKVTVTEAGRLLEEFNNLLAMREACDTCTTYSGRTHDIGVLMVENRDAIRASLAAQAEVEALRAENERLREAGQYLLRAWDQVASEDEDILLAVPVGSKVFSIASARKALDTEGAANG